MISNKRNNIVAKRYASKMQGKIAAKKLQQKNAAVWGISSAGRASALHAEGQRFDPAMLHHLEINLEKSRFLFCPK